jgi:gliding motility-associated protein GldE
MPLTEALHQSSDLSFSVLNFVVLGILILLSAFASGSEAAFFSLGPKEKEKLKEEESKSNNFVNVGIVILSSAMLNDYFGPAKGNETLRFLVEIIGITFMLLLLGEVIPKIYSTKNSLSIARTMAFPINTIKRIPPLSWLKTFLVNGTNLIQKKAKRKGIKITSDELEQALALTKEDSTSDEEHKLLEGIVKFGNTDARQIMKSRLEMTAIPSEMNFHKVLDVILDAGYSRMPVYENDLDNVIGILYIKDLLSHLSEDENFDWLKLIRKPLFTPENKKIDDLLKEFQEKKMHMAIIVDEYGGACGLITLEDILEEIVGDITDEFDDDEIVYTKIDDSTYLFEGKTALVDLYKVLEIDGKEFEQSKGDSETIGGFIVEHAGRILKNNEYIIFDEIKFIVESSDKRRVKMVKAVLKEN